jgi:hypothetical protein
MKNQSTLSDDTKLEQVKEEYICNYLAKNHYKIQNIVDLRKYKSFITKEKVLINLLLELGFNDLKSLNKTALAELINIL